VIDHVRGRVVERAPGSLVIAVGGLGLEIASTRAAERVAAPGQEATVLTHLHVREDALQLFGFGSTRERALFRLLLGVSGVGPRLALAIVSAYAPDDLERAIANQDVALLSSVSGVGRKTAQKICVDLRDRVAPVGVASAPPPAAAAVAAVPESADLGDPFYAAREALVALGYSLADAEAALQGSDGDESMRVRAALGRLAGAVR
jgi:Holliday junction DNA helicase RuvA